MSIEVSLGNYGKKKIIIIINRADISELKVRRKLLAILRILRPYTFRNKNNSPVRFCIITGNHSNACKRAKMKRGMTFL